MTPDLQRLQQSSETLGPILERIELELVDDPAWGEPSDTSYLSEKERANPDIAANVAAMTETNKLIAWFGRDSEGYVGMWRGPSQRPVTEAPVVRLDTEGQYAIVAPTLADYIAMSVPEDEFASVRETLVGAGFEVGSNPDAIWGALDAFEDDPNEYRNVLYRENKAKLGATNGVDHDHDHDHGEGEHDHSHDDEDEAAAPEVAEPAPDAAAVADDEEEAADAAEEAADTEDEEVDDGAAGDLGHAAEKVADDAEAEAEADEEAPPAKKPAPAAKKKPAPAAKKKPAPAAKKKPAAAAKKKPAPAKKKPAAKKKR